MALLNAIAAGSFVLRRCRPTTGVGVAPGRFVSLVLLLLAALHGPVQAAPASLQGADVSASLFSWAIKLSGYARPAAAPVIEYVSQAFLDANACGGHNFRVWGWYPNTGKAVVYVQEGARALLEDGSDPRSLLAASIVVHEFTHFLQAAQRGFAAYGCASALQLEREAYNVQNAYLAAYGSYERAGISMHNAGCGRDPHALPAAHAELH